MSNRWLVVIVSVIALLVGGVFLLVLRAPGPVSALGEAAAPPERPALDVDSSEIEAVRTTAARADAAPPSAPEAPAPPETPLTRENSAMIRGNVRQPGATSYSQAGIVELWSGKRRVGSTQLLSGRFHFVCLADVRYTILVQVHGYPPVEKEHLAVRGQQQVVVDLPEPIGTIVRVELVAPNGRPFLSQLTPAQLDVASYLRPVLSKKRPVEGTVVDGSVDILVARGTSAPNLVDPEWFTMRAEPQSAGWCSLALSNRVLQVQGFVNGGTVQFVLDPSELQVSTVSVQGLVVRDETGGPIEGATVRIQTSHGKRRETRTDAAGILRVDDVHVGPIQIDLQAADRVPVTLHALIVPGRTHELGVVRLARLVLVRGRVEGPLDLLGGQSVMSVRLSGDENDPYGDMTMSPIAPDGRFVISLVEPGRYLMGWAKDLPSKPLTDDLSQLGLVLVDASRGDVEGVVVPMTTKIEASLRALRSQYPTMGEVHRVPGFGVERHGVKTPDPKGPPR